MDPRPLGQTGLSVTPIGFGAFKIGRNTGVKYPAGYDLPDDEQAAKLLNAVLDMGINYIDTAPAYGISEQRIGKLLSDQRDRFVLSTKVGEQFRSGESVHDFSEDAVRLSVERSLKALRTTAIDIVYIHAHDDDLAVMEQSEAPAVLSEMKQRGVIRAVGLSGKTEAGFRAAMDWADVFMVEFNSDNDTLGPLIKEASARGIGIVVKKGLASGHLPADGAVSFVLRSQGVDSLLIGGLNPDHLRANIESANHAIATT